MKFPWNDDFLRSKGMLPAAKAIYLTCCLEPLSASDLSRMIPMGRGNVLYHIRPLVRLGWIVPRRQGRRVVLLPSAPGKVQVKYAGILKSDLDMAVYRGEAQMKVLLDEIVVSRDFRDNARPDFLRSPVTDLNLEYDRYYRNLAAFEHDGAQHRGATAKYPDKRRADNTRANDLMKSGISSEKNIVLVRVTKTDLTVEGMLKLIPSCLKTWPLVEGPYLDAIRQTCDQYQATETGENQLRGNGSPGR